MASPAAVLSILVDANTSSASAKLVEYQAQLDRIDARARRGIETRLGAEFNPRGFAAYQAATDKAIAKARDKAAFKAELGANYSPAGFTAYQRAVDKANLSTREASRSQVALGSAVDRGRGHLMGMASVAAGASLGIAYLGKASVDTAVTFQRSMEQVHTQAGASQAQVDALSKAVERLGPAVGTGPKDLADGMYHVVSSLNATLPPAQRMTKEMEALKIAAEGAKVGNANLVDVTNALDAAIVSGIGGAQDMGKAMGALNAIVGAGDMHMQDLADAFSTGLLGPMKNFGVSLKDIGGALAVFGDNNIRGQEAATKLNSAIRIMAAPSKAAAKELGGIGITATQLADDIRNKGLVVALEDLKQHLVDSGQTASQQARTLAIAFGGRQSTGVQLLIGQMDRLKAKTAEVGDGANRFGSDWAATQKTMAFRTGRLSAELQTLGLKVGAALAPVIPVLVTMAGKLGVFVSQMQSGQGAGGQFASAMKTAFGIVKTAATDVLDVFGGIKGTIEAIAVGYAATKLLSIARSFQALGSGLRSVTGSGIVGSTAAAAAGADSAAVGGARGALGKVASGLGGVLRFAGWAAFAAPLGIALTNVVGKWVDANAPTDGKRWADRFVKGMPDISEQLRVKLGRAADRALSQPLANARSEIARAVSAGAPPPVRGRVPQRDLKPTSAERQATIAAWFDQGWESGKAVVRGLQSVKDVSTPIVMQTFLEKLRQLPARAQPEAAKVMVNFATGLQQTGKISMRALQGILRSLEGQIPGFSAYLQSQGMVTAREFADTLKFTQATDTLKKTLKGMSSQFGFTQAGIKITTGDMNTDVTRAMTEMRKIIAGSSGNARKDAIAEFDKLKAGVSGRLSAMGHDVATKSGQMRDDIANNTHGAWKSASSNMGNFAAAVASAINSGAVGTGQGMNILISNLNKALKEMGQKQLSPVQVGAMTLSIGKQKQLQGFAHGGLMQVGRPGEAGRDTVPLNVGGHNIVVGAGEQVAVFTRHQQHVANRALAPMGGLPGLFSKVSRPNYMAGGGMVGGGSAISKMIGEANAINSRHFPYLWGGGHNSAFSGPYDCSGAVSAVLHSAGLLNAPEVSGQLMSYGLPGPGAVTIYANPVHTFMSIDGRFFGTHGAAGAGWYDGSARAGFTVRHAPVGAGLGEIPEPSVHGGGVVGKLTRSAVGMADKAANKLLSKVLAKMTAGGQSGGGDWGTFGGGRGVESQLARVLSAQGFNRVAVAGILGNVAQESNYGAASPNLFQFTPPIPGSSGSVAQQVALMMSHGGAGLVGTLNAAGSPSNAATLFMNLFEKPGIPALANRQSAAQAAFAQGFAKGGLAPKFAGAFANGGVVTANGPTMAMFGENGPETAVFLPHFASGGSPDALPVHHHRAAQHPHRAASRKHPKSQAVHVPAAISDALKRLLPDDVVHIDTIAARFAAQQAALATANDQLTYTQGLPPYPAQPLVTLSDADVAAMDPHGLLGYQAGDQIPNPSGMTINRFFGPAGVAGGQWVPGISQRQTQIAAQLANLYGQKTALGKARKYYGNAVDLDDAAKKQRQRRYNRVLAFLRKQVIKAKAVQAEIKAITAGNLRQNIARALSKQAIGARVASLQEQRSDVVAELAAERRHQASLPKAERDPTHTANLQAQLAQVSDSLGVEKTLRTSNAASVVVQAAKSKVLKSNLTDRLAAIATVDRNLGGSPYDVGSGGLLGRLQTQMDAIDANKVTEFSNQAGIAPAMQTVTNAIASYLAESKLLPRTSAIQVRTPADTTPPDTTTTVNPRDALLQTLLTQSQQALAVSQAQYRVLQGMPPYGGSFATGGVVPGPFGAPRTIIAHGGEMVGGPQGATEVHWHVANGMEWLKQFVQVEIKQGGRRTQRFAARQLPGGR